MVTLIWFLILTPPLKLVGSIFVTINYVNTVCSFADNIDAIIGFLNISLKFSFATDVEEEIME